MVLFKDISYKALQLSVTTGNADVSKLNIFRAEQKYIPAWGLTVHAGIIGTSHFVQIQHDNGACFTELFACEVLEETSAKSLCFLPIADLDETIQLQTDLFQYQFKCHLQDYHTSSQRIADSFNPPQFDAPLIFLSFDFKTPQENLPPSKTILAIRQIENGIAIQTVHEYQEENSIVISDSTIMLSQ